MRSVCFLPGEQRPPRAGSSNTERTLTEIDLEDRERPRAELCVLRVQHIYSWKPAVGAEHRFAVGYLHKAQAGYDAAAPYNETHFCDGWDFDGRLAPRRVRVPTTLHYRSWLPQELDSLANLPADENAAHGARKRAHVRPYAVPLQDIICTCAGIRDLLANRRGRQMIDRTHVAPVNKSSFSG